MQRREWWLLVAGPRAGVAGRLVLGDEVVSAGGAKRSPRVHHEGDRLRGQMERRLGVGGFAILALGGGGILWALYGGTAALAALAVILGGAGVVALLWLLLILMGAWARSD